MKLISFAFNTRPFPKYMITACFFLLWCSWPVCSLMAQQQVGVSGTVSDAQTNETLPGVNILVKGTSTGASTDSDGNYELMVESLQDTLVVSFVGYKTQQVPIDGRTEIDVALQTQAISGEEMVVVGYGTQKKKNIIGAVGEKKIKDISTRPSADIARSLQGAIPGLNIKASSGGDPSASPEINIRGFNSINGGSPLILVDGIEEDISNVNPNDIESVSVLKDAESSAIYGARGSFGVVLIKTKSGKPGEFNIEYSNNIGFKTNTARTDFITDPYKYAKIVDGAIGNYTGGCYLCYDDDDWDIIQQVANGEIAPYHEKQSDGTYKFYHNTDYYDLQFKKRRSLQMHNLQISGGTKKLNGYFSGRIYKTEKIQKIADADMKRYNLKLNINFKPYDWLEFSSIGKVSDKFNEAYSGTRNGWTGVYGISRWRDQFPNFPAIVDGYATSVGREGTGYGGRIGSLLQRANHRQWKNEKLTNQLKAKLIPFKNLEINADYSHSIAREDLTYRYHPFEYLSGNKLDLVTAGLNRLGEWRYKDYYDVLNIFGTYAKGVGDKHDFKLMLGYNQEKFDRDRIGAQMEGLLTREKDNFNLGTEMYNIEGSTQNWAIQGFYGRFNYDYDKKYLLEINTRYDGSSRFPKGNQWGFFPSIAVGWQVDKENFWTSSIKNVISSLKVRGSYGRLGNQTVGLNTFRQLIGMGKTSWLVDNQSLNYARVPSPLPANIEWEKVNSANIGVDFGFLENKLTASLDIYERNTYDMYLPGEPLPSTFGASEPKRNYASLRNRGFELSVGYNDQFEVGGSELSFNISANVSNSKGVITKFDNPNGLMSTFWEGQELGEIWGYHIDGQFKSDEAAAEYQSQFNDPKKDLIKAYESIFGYTTVGEWDHLKAGDIKYSDVNGDGKIDKGDNTLENHGDLVPIGNAMPKFPFGFNINAKWKQIDVSAIGQGILKQDWYPTGPFYWGTYERPYISFLRKDLYDKAFDPENPNNTDNIYPQKERAYIAVGGTRSLYNLNDYYLTNLGYLRIKNLTIGYTLPKSMTERFQIKDLRIYFSAENIFTWSFGDLTKYLDPEEMGSTISYSNPNNVGARGNKNVQQYPMFKTYSLGIQIRL